MPACVKITLSHWHIVQPIVTTASSTGQLLYRADVNFDCCKYPTYCPRDTLQKSTDHPGCCGTTWCDRRRERQWSHPWCYWSRRLDSMLAVSSCPPCSMDTMQQLCEGKWRLRRCWKGKEERKMKRRWTKRDQRPQMQPKGGNSESSDQKLQVLMGQKITQSFFYNKKIPL